MAIGILGICLPVRPGGAGTAFIKRGWHANQGELDASAGNAGFMALEDVGVPVENRLSKGEEGPE